MGNCSLKAVDDATKDLGFARIMTDSGQLLHLRCPKSVRQLLAEFPGYNVYGQGHMSSPMSEQHHLQAGQFYYLLPVAGETEAPAPENEVRVEQLVTRLGLEVLAPPRKGVWKVKFVIDSQQLGEILAEDENTEAMIEQMRSAAISSPKGRRKSSWGGSLKVIFANAFKMPLENQNKVQALDSCTNSPSSR
nr:Dihydroxy-acid dehydratase [Ipomoea batatas]